MLEKIQIFIKKAYHKLSGHSFLSFTTRMCKTSRTKEKRLQLHISEILALHNRIEYLAYKCLDEGHIIFLAM